MLLYCRRGSCERSISEPGYFSFAIATGCVPVHVVCSDDIAAVVQKYWSAICTLAYCSKVEFCTSPPQGCAILTLSDKCEVHLLLKVWMMGAKAHANLNIGSEKSELYGELQAHAILWIRMPVMWSAFLLCIPDAPHSIVWTLALLSEGFLCPPQQTPK